MYLSTLTLLGTYQELVPEKILVAVLSEDGASPQAPASPNQSPAGTPTISNQACVGSWVRVGFPSFCLPDWGRLRFCLAKLPAGRISKLMTRNSHTPAPSTHPLQPLSLWDPPWGHVSSRPIPFQPGDEVGTWQLDVQHVCRTQGNVMESFEQGSSRLSATLEANLLSSWHAMCTSLFVIA